MNFVLSCVESVGVPHVQNEFQFFIWLFYQFWILFCRFIQFFWVITDVFLLFPFICSIFFGHSISSFSTRNSSNSKLVCEEIWNLKIFWNLSFALSLFVSPRAQNKFQFSNSLNSNSLFKFLDFFLQFWFNFLHFSFLTDGLFVVSIWFCFRLHLNFRIFFQHNVQIVVLIEYLRVRRILKFDAGFNCWTLENDY